jgi:hypothetical protein
MIILHSLHPTQKHNMPHSSGTTSTTTTTRLLEFTSRQNALRARYADRVAQEARRIWKSARRIALWNARIRKANTRLYPTANEEEGQSIGSSEPMQNDQRYFFSNIFFKFYNIIKIII